MGKLLTGRYGEEPSAESTIVSLSDCHQRLGMKPSDFVSVEPPEFFKKAHGAKGRYLVFQTESREVMGNPIWRAGYYLLPIEAAAILEAFARKGARPGTNADGSRSTALPVEVDTSANPPEPIVANAKRWAQDSQPLFFKCKCDHLELTIDAPWGLRRRWKAHLKCPDRCQPQIKTLI